MSKELENLRHAHKMLWGVLQDSVNTERRYRKALEEVISNIGVPQPGYPAPFAEAYRIAKEALDE